LWVRAITAALTAGVSLLCVPQGRDQHYNAERVAATGVGRSVPTDAPAADIATAVTELLADPAPRREARRFADNIAQLGGGRCATEKVVALHRRAEVRPSRP
jgi:UDP:flavonoid glycosyltransferase YjiC (YdhE family)